MKRKLFFWLENLKISRSERRSITVLIILLTGLAFINAFIKPALPFDREYYAALEQKFKQRTALLKQNRQKLMARYAGVSSISVGADSIPLTGIIDTISQNVQLPTWDELININTGNINALKKLPGIGPAYAQNIIDYRLKNGPFTTKKELMKVKGIGNSRFAKIELYIKLRDKKNDSISIDANPAESQKVSNSNSSKKIIKPASQTLINVNKADAKLLEILPGIGPTYAQHIVDYRRKHGPFTTMNELLKIKGIGKKRLAKLKPFIKLTGDKSNQ